MERTVEYKNFVAEVKSVDYDNLIIEHFISTEEEDRSKDIMRSEGMVINGKVVVLKEHGKGNMGNEPIAKPLEIYTGQKDDGTKGIIAKTQYYPDDEGKRLHKKAAEGYMPNFSIGFIPMIASPKSNGGRDVKKWELVEYSQVGVPDNPGATTFKALVKHKDEASTETKNDDGSADDNNSDGTDSNSSTGSNNTTDLGSKDNDNNSNGQPKNSQETSEKDVSALALKDVPFMAIKSLMKQVTAEAAWRALWTLWDTLTEKLWWLADDTSAEELDAYLNDEVIPVLIIWAKMLHEARMTEEGKAANLDEIKQKFFESLGVSVDPATQTETDDKNINEPPEGKQVLSFNFGTKEPKEKTFSLNLESLKETVREAVKSNVGEEFRKITGKVD